MIVEKWVICNLLGPAVHLCMRWAVLICTNHGCTMHNRPPDAYTSTNYIPRLNIWMHNLLPIYSLPLIAPLGQMHNVPYLSLSKSHTQLVWCIGTYAQHDQIKGEILETIFLSRRTAEKRILLCKTALPFLFFTFSVFSPDGAAVDCLVQFLRDSAAGCSVNQPTRVSTDEIKSPTSFN